MKHLMFTLIALAAYICTSDLKAQLSTPESKQLDETPESLTFMCAFGKITVGDKVVETCIQWNTKTGEARLLNAASFADKATGQQGNLIGWVPLIDLQKAVQDLAKQIQDQQAIKATTLPLKKPLR